MSEKDQASRQIRSLATTIRTIELGWRDSLPLDVRLALTAAGDRVEALASRVEQLERENRWLRSIISEYVGTDPENIDEGHPPTPEEEAEEADFQRRIDERRRRMFGDDCAGRG